MALKKSEIYKGIDLPESYHKIIGKKTLEASDDGGVKKYLIWVIVAQYSDPKKIEPLEEPCREYLLQETINGKLVPILMTEEDITHENIYVALKKLDKFKDAEDC